MTRAKDSKAREAAQARARAERLAFQGWTAPIGTKVEVTKDDGSKVETVTESMPWLVGAGTPLIKLRGIVGGYLLTRVRVLPPPGEEVVGRSECGRRGAPDNGTLPLFGPASATREG